jgi:hypothetical protein
MAELNRQQLDKFAYKLPAFLNYKDTADLIFSTKTTGFLVHWSIGNVIENDTDSFICVVFFYDPDLEEITNTELVAVLALTPFSSLPMGSTFQCKTSLRDMHKTKITRATNPVTKSLATL